MARRLLWTRPPNFAHEQYDNIEGYAEDVIGAIDNPPLPPAPVAAPALAVESVMKLTVKDLKDELKKRGRAITGKKSDLQDRLKEAVRLNVPVAGPSEEPHHKSMAGLDMSARWVPLTWNDEPIVVPGVNSDPSHRPPTEMNQDVNPKYDFVETFNRMPFTGTTEKMCYGRPPCDSAICNKKKERKRKRLPTRQMRVPADVEPRVLGEPNSDFLKRYGLDETNHPMDWFTAFMPLTPDANKEDPAIVNVKGDHKTKFAVSNWTAYSNTKAMMCNAGEKSHIFAGKFR